MPVAYPFALRTFIRETKSRSQPATFRMVEPRRGYGYAESIGTDVPVFWSVTFRFTACEAMRFRMWFELALQRGLLEFTIPIRTEFGLVTHTCRFLPDSLLPTREIGEVWEYTATVMARALVIPADALTAHGAAFAGPIPSQTLTAGVPFTLNLATYFTGGLGPFTYSVWSGTLPAGLALDPATGVVAGTPTGTLFGTVVFERKGAYCSETLTDPVSFVLGDAYAGSNVILLPFEDGNNTTTFTDIGPGALTVSILQGSPIESTALARVGTGSLLGSGEPSQLTFTTPTSTTASWTFDCWYRRNGTGRTGFICIGGGNLVFRLRTPGDSGTYEPSVTVSGTVVLSGASPTPLNVWQHLEVSYEAISISNGHLRIFQDGSLSAAQLNRTSLGMGGFISLGRTDPAGFSGLLGNIDMYRLTMGVCRHTANFTPPTTMAEYL